MQGNLEEAPLLIGQTGPLKGERWVLDKTLTIGRELTCEIVIPDRQVSRFHARLTPKLEGMVLEDLGSKNGVHCNGTPVVGQVTLQDGDMVQIALAQQFLYLTSDATVPLTDFDEASGRLRMDLRSRRVWVNDQLIIRDRWWTGANWWVRRGAKSNQSAYRTRLWMRSFVACETGSQKSMRGIHTL
jgi:pSer/pThr/pTyr-binding forkhead associated (FHA) protein